MHATKRQERFIRETEILAVAARHLNTMGVSVEWFSEIAASLNLTRPALYKYTSDREDLLFRCYAESCNALERRIDAAIAAHPDPVSALSALLELPGDEEETAVISEIAALDPERQAIIRRRLQMLEERLTSLLSDGTRNGVFRALDAGIVARVIMGMISWLPLYRRWGGAVADVGSVMRGSSELLFHGLAPGRRPVSVPEDQLVTVASQPLDLFDKEAVNAAKRERILAVASALFNTRGIGATRIEDVAAELGLTKRAIYHSVGQKQMLVDACVERAYKFFLELMDIADRMPATRLEALCTCIRDLLLVELNPEISILSPYVGFGQLSPDEHRRVAEYGQRMHYGYFRMLEQGIAENSVRSVPVHLIVAGLPGVFSWAANISDEGPVHRKRIANEIADLVARGILA